MKIGIYSDLHLCRTTGIMPLYCKDSDKYTTRLNMIVNTAKWMYDEFEKNGVDFIVNCGDTVDSSVLKADELSALKDFYNYSKGTQEYHIVGNHEMSDDESRIYSTYILGQLPFVKIFDKSIKIIVDGVKIAFLPYIKPNKISYDIFNELSADILFSHIDIIGSNLRGTYILEDGVEPEILAEKFKMVINGHLHTSEKIETSKNSVWNIGSVSSISFVDSNVYVPSICILDTDTYKIKRIENPHSILFRKYHINSIDDLKNRINSLNKSNKYIVNVKCKYSLKDDVKDFLKSYDNIITSRVTIDTMATNDNELQKINISDIFTFDIESEFIKFLKETNSCTNGTIEDYISVIRGE